VQGDWPVVLQVDPAMQLTTPAEQAGLAPADVAE
jgi:hypothetical protein